MTQLQKQVRRVVKRSGRNRNLIVTLFPATDASPAEVEVREAYCRTGYRWTVAQLFTHMACQSAGVLPRGRGRRAKGV